MPGPGNGARFTKTTSWHRMTIIVSFRVQDLSRNSLLKRVGRPVYIWFKQTQGSQQQATHTGAYQVQRTQSYPPSTGYQHVQTVPQPSVPQTSPGPGTQLGAELNTETGPEQITQALSCLSVAESAGAESNTQAGAEQNTQTDADQNTQTDAHQDTQTGAQQTPLSQPYHITITGQQPSQLHRYQSYGQTGAQQDIYRSVQQNVPTGIQHTPLGQPYQSSYTGQQASNTHGYQPQVQAVHPSQSHYQNQVPGYQTYGQAAQTYQGPQGRPGHQPPQQAFHLQTYVPLRNDTQHGNADHHDHQHANHRDSGSFAAVPDSNVAAMPEPVPAHIRQRLPALVPGTPQQGWYEHLDPSYRMRTGREAHEFFQIGRVFSVLWAEAASETAARQAARQAGHIEDGTVRGFRKPDYTTGRFGEIVYSNIRRFVVMQVKRKSHFVYAW